MEVGTWRRANKGTAHPYKWCTFTDNCELVFRDLPHLDERNKLLVLGRRFECEEKSMFEKKTPGDIAESQKVAKNLRTGVLKLLRTVSKKKERILQDRKGLSG